MEVTKLETIHKDRNDDVKGKGKAKGKEQCKKRGKKKKMPKNKVPRIEKE